MSVNKAILIGRVGKDPEIKTVGSDALANFSLATSERFKNKSGEQVENTEWHNIIAWRKLAELAEKYVHKGDQIYVEGKITNRSYEDKDGNKKYTSEIVINEMRFLGSKQSDPGAYQPAPVQTDPAKDEVIPGVEDTDSGLPF
jgi:single-strand DNA-binding protein